MFPTRYPFSAERERFVADLLGYMTLEEMAGQLVLLPNPGHSDGNLGRYREDALFDRLRAGAVSAIAGVPRAGEADALQRIAVEESRLGIPLLFAADTATGRDTVMPIPVSAAASWDPDAIEAAERAIAAEAGAAGITWAMAPQVRRSPYRAATGFSEGAGESALLARRITLARIRGLQSGSDDGLKGLCACLGLVSSYRNNDPDWPASISEQASNELALILAAMGEGVGSLALDGRVQDSVERTGNHGDPFGWISRPGEYPGIDLSEWCDIAVAAGQEPGPPPYFNLSVERVVAAVRLGHLAEFKLADAARKVLGVKYDLGLFRGELAPRRTGSRPSYRSSRESHHAAALDLASKSVILLRNSPALLPLPRGESLLVVGAAAEDASLPLGGKPGQAISVVAGLQAAHIPFRYAPGLAIRHDDDAPSWSLIDADRLAIGMAAEAAKRARTVVLALGDTPGGSNAGTLGEAQQRLLEALHAANPRLVLLTLGERPVDPLVAGGPVPAVLHAGKLGTTSGEAIARILSGAVAPTGRLPYALGPRDGGGLPFGHGLTFTDFVLRNVGVEFGADAVLVGAELMNTGDVEGSAMVQIYVRREGGHCPMRRLSLRDFGSIRLDAGERRRITFALGSEELGFFGSDGRYHVEAGSYDIRIGLDAQQANGSRVHISEEFADAILSSGQPRGPSRALPAAG